ncbi:MAG: phytoene/squalene synthase family protein [Alphaproteobacteria bacterium]
MDRARSDASALIDLVRRVDHDRYLCALFAPPERRPALFALIAFNHEIARAREAVSEPMLGQIRLQWWRESIEGIYGGTVRRHEVVEPLADAVEQHGLSRASFDALIDARERDFDDAPMADLAALEAYAEATAAPLAALTVEALGERECEAARCAATAFALVGLMRAVPFHAARSRLYLPADRLAAHGLSAAEALSGRFSAPLGAVIGEVLGRAEQHLAAARSAMTAAPRAARPALLPGRLAAMHRARLAALGNNPYDPRATIGPLRRQLGLLIANLSGRL